MSPHTGAQRIASGMAVLGLLTCVAGVIATIAGGTVRVAPTPQPRWLERYALLRPFVQDSPHVGFFGSKRDFFRAQYVLAPVVLEVVGPPRRRLPALVIVTFDAPADRHAAVDWLRAEAERRGGTARAHAVGPRLLLVELTAMRGRR